MSDSVSSLQESIELLAEKQQVADIEVYTLGTFDVKIKAQSVENKSWGRDKTVQLFQYLITARHHKGLHKELIADRIWEDLGKSVDQTFKVALHGINKVLEPNRESRSEPQYILRQGITYHLNLDKIWIDAEAMEQYVAIGNRALIHHPSLATEAYRNAVDLHRGIYLPNRLYEDWSAAERERLQLLAMGAMIDLAQLLLNQQPQESIRLAQMALRLDSTWEDAYRVQMKAYLARGNRPMALKTYRQCSEIIQAEFGIDPLPETKKLLETIKKIGHE